MLCPFHRLWSKQVIKGNHWSVLWNYLTNLLFVCIVTTATKEVTKYVFHYTTRELCNLLQIPTLWEKVPFSGIRSVVVLKCVKYSVNSHAKLALSLPKGETRGFSALNLQHSVCVFGPDSHVWLPFGIPFPHLRQFCLQSHTPGKMGVCVLYLHADSDWILGLSYYSPEREGWSCVGWEWDRELTRHLVNLETFTLVKIQAPNQSHNTRYFDWET